MSLPRFYCPALLAPGAAVRLPANAATHASRALRLQHGDAVILFNGDGMDYYCELASVSKSAVTAEVRSGHKNLSESPLRITLAQAISAGDRMDFTIQKAVETGVTAIQPLASQRSVVKLIGERADKRREHWQNVVIAACEQSGRAVVPEVFPPLSLPNWLATLTPSPLRQDGKKGVINHAPTTPSPSQREGRGEDINSLRLTLSPNATQTLHELPTPKGEICLLVGAEGGLTDDEISLAASHSFIPVRLGKRILRTETAPLAALAAMQTLWGDYN